MRFSGLFESGDDRFFNVLRRMSPGHEFVGGLAIVAHGFLGQTVEEGLLAPLTQFLATSQSAGRLAGWVPHRPGEAALRAMRCEAVLSVIACSAEMDESVARTVPLVLLWQLPRLVNDLAMLERPYAWSEVRQVPDLAASYSNTTEEAFAQLSVQWQGLVGNADPTFRLVPYELDLPSRWTKMQFALSGLAVGAQRNPAEMILRKARQLLREMPPSRRDEVIHAVTAGIRVEVPIPHQTGNLRDRALELFQSGQFDQALPLLETVLKTDPNDWNVRYLVGQAYRFRNQYATAIQYLTQASRQAPREPSVWMALGIARQLNGDLDAALQALKSAIDLDRDYVEGYNSLGITLSKMGQYQKAVDAYEAGLEALARQIVKRMHNDRGSPIIKHRDTAGALWLQYAFSGAVYLASTGTNIERLAWPTGQSAMEEERTEVHKGLYYLDTLSPDGKHVRQFFPNYFNTFREALRGNLLYTELTLNRGRAFERLGDVREAHDHFREAEEFKAIR